MKKLVLSSLLLIGVCLTSNAENLESKAEVSIEVMEDDDCVTKRVTKYDDNGDVI